MARLVKRSLRRPEGLNLAPLHAYTTITKTLEHAVVP